MKSTNEEIIKRVSSIIFWSMFLYCSTIYWYIPQNKMLNEVKNISYAISNNQNFYLEEISNISMIDIYPTEDEYGIENDPIKFKIVNNLNNEITYKVYFKNEATINPLNNNYLRYQLIKNNEVITTQNLNTDSLIFTSDISTSTEDYYELRIWLDQEAGNEAQNKSFAGKLLVDAVNK